MFKTLALATLAVVGLTSAVDVPFSNCRPETDIQVTSMTATSWPPVKGADMSSVTTANVANAVEGGEFTITTYWAGMNVSTIKGDFCKYRENGSGGHLPCPLAAGPTEWANGGIFPANAPAGKYEMTTTINDKTGKQVMCLVNRFTVR